MSTFPGERRLAERRAIERATDDRRATVIRLIDLGHQIEARRDERAVILAHLESVLEGHLVRAVAS